MFLKARVAAYVMMALRSLPRFTISFIITVLTFYPCQGLDKTMGAGLDAIKQQNEEIAENGRIMKPLMRNYLYTTLRLSMKCGNGFKLAS